MARKQLELAPMQERPQEFADMTAAIKKLGPFTLAGFGLVSRATLYKYMDGIGVSEETEQAILKSIKLAVAAREQTREAQRVEAREVLKTV